jgi:translation initiation factor IF-3
LQNFFKPRGGKPRIRENVNEGIRAKEVRAVFPDGTTKLLPTAAALKSAKELNLDLILISANAIPPVAKLVEYGKWEYENKKKQKAAKRNQHIQLLKELKFRPGTEEHDYDFKRKHAVEFLQEGHKVKASCQFKGREITHAQIGKDLLMRLAADLATYGTVEGVPRFEGKSAHILISPVKK